MGVILFKILGEMPAVGFVSHHRMRGIKRRLEQLMMRRGFQSIRNKYGVCEMVFPHV